jgi:hypothetical protein
MLDQVERDLSGIGADESAIGRSSLTVDHGELKTPTDFRRFEELSRAFDRLGQARYRRSHTGSTFTTFVFGPPDADAVVAELARVVRRVAPDWAVHPVGQGPAPTVHAHPPRSGDWLEATTRRGTLGAELTLF